MTLFDLSKKKGMKTPEKKKSSSSKKKMKSPHKGLKTPDKKPKVSPQKTPAIVSRLIHAVKANDKGKIKSCMETACKVLTLKHREKLPPNIRELVENSIARREEKRKL